MIPLVAISNALTLPFLAFISLKLYGSFRKSGDKNIRYFFLAFFLTFLMEILLSSPGLIFKDIAKIGAVFAIYPFFGFLALVFFAAISFSILKKEKIEKLFLIFLIFIAILFTAINLVNLKPAVTYQNPPFIYWEDTRGTAMNIFLGGLFGLLLLFSIFFFFFNGLKTADKYVQKRSFIISGGIFIFFLAALVNFVFGAGQTQYKYITSIISAIIMIFGSVTIFIGINYKRKSEEVVNVGSPEYYSKIQW